MSQAIGTLTGVITFIALVTHDPLSTIGALIITSIIWEGLSFEYNIPQNPILIYKAPTLDPEPREDARLGREGGRREREAGAGREISGNRI